VKASSPYDLSRTDRNPRPEYPVLIVVSSQREAEELQKRLHPSEFYVTSVNGPLVGHRFRMIQVCISAWENKMRASPSRMEIESVNRFLTEYLPTKLAAGCEQYIFRL